MLDEDFKSRRLQLEHQLLTQLVIYDDHSPPSEPRALGPTMSVNTCNIASFAAAVKVTYTRGHARVHLRTHRHTSPTVKVNWVHVL